MDDTLRKVGSALKRFWETKPLRVRQNEISVYQNFQKVIVFRDKKYWLSLSLLMYLSRKPSHPMLPDHSEQKLGKLLKHL